MTRRYEILTMLLDGVPVAEVAAIYGVREGVAKQYALICARRILAKGFWKSRPSCFEDVLLMKKMIDSRSSE